MRINRWPKTQATEEPAAKTMSLEGKTLKVCSCNRTVALDAKALGAALNTGEPLAVHHQLCRRDAGAFQAALGKLAGRDRRLHAGGAALRRARRGLARAPSASSICASMPAGRPRLGAPRPRSRRCSRWLALPEPEPAPSVEFKSEGQLLIIGPADAALEWAQRLSGPLEVSVLSTARGELPLERSVPGLVGQGGGAFGLARVPSRSNGGRRTRSISSSARAAMRASARARKARSTSATRSTLPSAPRTAIASPPAATSAPSILRARRRRGASASIWCSICRAQPLIRSHELPQGYFAPGDDPLEQALAAQKLVSLVGEFEKPRFFRYREKICAHSRSGREGCNACIEVCSSGAIRADGDRVKVEPHLCAGCGGCATVCPSGAMSYAYPQVPDLGLRLKTIAFHLPRCRRKGRLHPVSRCRRGSTRRAAARQKQRPAGARHSHRMLPCRPRSAWTSCSARSPTAQPRLRS